jgi:ABC-type nickel/cobalt efflux system permease component RcnA
MTTVITAAVAFTIGTVIAVWAVAVAAWSLATYAARVVEEDDIDYTDTESDAA